MAAYRALTSTRISRTFAANEEFTVPATGRFYYLTRGTDVDITVLDDQKRKLVDKVTLVAGRGIKFPETWETLGYTVTIKSPSAQAVILDVIDGEIVDNSFIISSASAISTTPSGTTLNSSAAAVSALATATTLISAAASNIQRRWFRNADAALTVYLRSTNATAQSAIVLGPGDVAILENQSAIYAYNPGGAPVAVWCDTETTT